MIKEQLRRMRLLGTVRFPSPTQGKAKISRRRTDPPVLVIRHKVKTSNGASAYVKQTVLLEHVRAIVTFKKKEEPIIGDNYGKWLFIRGGGNSTKAFVDYMKKGKQYHGIAFVHEDAPVLVESTLREPFVTFAGDQGFEVDGDSPGESPGVCIKC